ncbi:MAG: HAMP domain-containing histidine kinase [Clostridiales bacterium]|jgi:signal transduction histidine kinase|nr:HAMP domain-containing histidine kinase [Clostridiales bacterium]
MKTKTFLTTMLLFLLTVFGGIVLIAVYTYRDTAAQARERANAGHYFIASGLFKDIAAMDERGADYRQRLADLMQTYGYLAENQNARIALYDGDRLVYSGAGEDAPLPPQAPAQNGGRLVTVTKDGAGSAVYVTGRLPAPYGNFFLIYRMDISESVAAWNRLKNMMFLMGTLLSCVLAAGLLALLDRLFRPLAEISQTSRRIASGEYHTRLAVKGKDELAEMAGSFNHMAGEIERQMAELTATAENKQLFIDNFAHELKTPLTAIYGYAEYMQKANLSGDDRRFALECVLSESRRIQTMAYQMMELANLRNDPVQTERVSVPELFKKTETAMRHKAAEKKMDLVFQSELPALYGSMNFLESLLINLTDNAINANEPGSPVFIKAFEYNGTPALSVKDRGKGISPQDLPKITQPYYKTEKNRSARDRGAGLGLAICEQIVKKHKGEMKFLSSPGNGTEVQVIFTTPQ